MSSPCCYRYAYAKTDRLADLEEFVAAPNTAKVGKVADWCYDDKLYKAAQILYVTPFALLSLVVLRTLPRMRASGIVINSQCLTQWLRCRRTPPAADAAILCGWMQC